MHLNQVFFIILLLMNAVWAITHQDDGKIRRITSTLVSRENRKLKNAEQSEKQIKLNSNDSNDDEDKKTLAQQVADGKYGLIQRELFSEPVKRPGILSYEINPEVPKDNVNNLGGLMPDEIWLAENHLLVLKGGNFGGEGKWPAIDNYVAPRRQVKIPQNPKVPPPFPVQLTDGGPTQFLRNKNNSNIGGIYPGNDTYPGNLHPGNGFEPFPFLLPLPPPVGAFLPRPENATELDEDDPSIYYPPPYDFVYPKDNSSFVPPGPLVPGIVVPPPPNFFSLLEKKTSRTKLNSTKTRQYRPQKRPITTTTNLPTISTTTTILPTISTTTIAPSKPTRITTTIKITTTYKSKPKLKATISPNEIVNTLPPNTPVGDWIPIPAPRPFYISLKPYTNDESIHQPGWKLFNRTNNKKNPLFDEYFYKPIFQKNQNPLYIENFSQKPNYYYYNQPQYETNTLAPAIHTKSTSAKYYNSPIDYFLNERFNKKLHTTKKPPIYEYSYSAPGYGTLEAPKIGGNFFDVSTQRPYRQNSFNKNYFELFGQKLNNDLTTALPNIKYRSTPAAEENLSYDYDTYYDERSTFEPKSYKNLYRNVRPISQYDYNEKLPISLHSDIQVNYKQPLPSLNPDAETFQPYSSQQSSIPQRASPFHSYQLSTANKQQYPTINQHHQYNIQSYTQSTPSPQISQRQPSSLISYQLPGTAGHFYFLTPQAAVK